MKKDVLVPIADGVEEIEAMCIIDTLRRADAQVVVASVGDLTITASREVRITADTTIGQCKDQTYDLIALPGGLPGANHLAACPELIQMLKDQKQSGKLFAAVCASPAVVLQPNGLLEGLRATCYPALQDQLDPGYVSQEPVVVDQNCITGQGPGFALAFALALVERLCGPETYKAVATDMLVAV